MIEGTTYDEVEIAAEMRRLDAGCVVCGECHASRQAAESCLLNWFDNYRRFADISRQFGDLANGRADASIRGELAYERALFSPPNAHLDLDAIEVLSSEELRELYQETVEECFSE